ncbi:MAG: DegT/DnrJ/EryC1/StrS family aminotransferase [Candidatus Woesearchaeota archaeon]
MVKSTLNKIFEKQNIYFVDKTRKGMEELFKTLDKNKIINFQEEGGWHTYPKSAKKQGFKINYLKQKNGKLIELPKKEEVLIINSMPGYCYSENIDKIAKHCKENKILLINDVTASIGTQKPVGDIIICSFGNHKPISIGTGGVIATNNKLSIQETKLNETKLEQQIKNLQNKLSYWKKIKKQIEKDLKEKVINKGEGINILVDDKKENLINYLNKNNLEYAECPKYIRTNKKCISIEIKRR